MEPIEQHTMDLRQTSIDKRAQEWVCSICGRHLIVRWKPTFQRVVLKKGDETAAHVGGDMKMGFTAEGPTAPPVTDLEREWLKANGMTWEVGRGHEDAAQEEEAC